MITGTPGNWRAVHNGLNAWRIVYNEAGNWIAEVFDEDDTEQAEIDARIIAASRDLLALIIQYRDDLRYPPDADSKERRLDAINAAIAKATGK